LKTIPNRIYERKELMTIMERMAEYKVLNIPMNIIVFGSRGSGKTVTILYLLKILRDEGGLKTFYLKARDYPTSYKIYQKMDEVTGVGYPMNTLRDKAIEKFKERSVIVIDDADFLEDFNFLYTFSRDTNTSIILLAQNIQFVKKIDESTYSSLQPSKIYFADYNSDELYQILKMRAEDGLYKWDEKALRLASAIVVRDYRSDTRIAIKSLLKLAITNEWDDESVKRAVEDASREVEALTLRELKDRDLITLYIVSKVKETSKAYPIFNTYMAKYEGRFLTKPIFFRT
jgi:cell division control protein 6